MKLTIEDTTDEIKKVLHAIAGSQEYKEGFQSSGYESIIMSLSSEHAKRAWNTLSTALKMISKQI